jgi:predicted DsbA family dithiol-disulfide isomerase
VPTLSAIYIDFQSPASYRVWRWVSLLPVRESIDVRPYSMDTAGEAATGPWDRSTPSSAGLELLALGELAREAGRDCHLRFVDRAFAAVHEAESDMSSLESWLALGSGLGLDLDAFTADSERWRAEVGLWHEEAKDEYGVMGVPSLVFGDSALLIDMDRPITDAAAARRLLEDLADLSQQPVVAVRRTA